MDPALAFITVLLIVVLHAPGIRPGKAVIETGGSFTGCAFPQCARCVSDCFGWNHRMSRTRAVRSPETSDFRWKPGL
jgi:hypothetical protein